MRGFVALLDRDWRDHRAIAAVMAAAILGLSMMFRSMAPDARYWQSAALVVVPAMWVLFVVGLACDVIGCEFPTRRIETLALLPASLMRLWTSKAAFLGIMLFSFLAWTLGCQFATCLAFADAGPDFARFLEGAARAIACFALPTIVIALLVATLVERTLPALFLSVVVAFGSFAGATWLLVRFAPDTARDPSTLITASLAMALVFAVTAARAFVAGRVHTTVRWRKWAVTASTLGAAVILLCGIVGWRVWSWRQVAPGDDDAVVDSISASPDGRWLAIHAMKYANRDAGFTASRVWTVPIDGGGAIVEAQDSICFDRQGAWSADGSLQTIGRDGSLARHQVVDPATGVIRSSVQYDPFAEDREHADRYYPYWAGPDPSLVNFRSDKSSRVVTWKERGISRRIDSVGVLAVSRLPGVVWYSPDGLRVVRLDFATGDELAVYESPAKVSGCWASADGTRLLLRSERRTRLLDAATGAAIAGPWESLQVCWARGSTDDGRFVHVPADGRETLVDSKTGRTVELATNCRLGQFGFVHAESLPDGRLVVLDNDGRIDLYDAAGALVRHLYTPKGN